VHIKRNASQDVVLWSNELMVLLVLIFSVANIQINTEWHESACRNKRKIHEKETAQRNLCAVASFMVVVRGIC